MKGNDPLTIALGVGLVAILGLMALNWAGVIGGIHEHAELEVYLNSSEPYDFSSDEYQLAAREVHFEEGDEDAGGATIHIHEEDLTLMDLFESIEWQVGQDTIMTDKDDRYEVDANHTLTVLKDGEPVEGFDVPLEDGASYTVRFAYEPSPSG